MQLKAEDSLIGWFLLASDPIASHSLWTLSTINGFISEIEVLEKQLLKNPRRNLCVS
jgi:hypothetical protein